MNYQLPKHRLLITALLVLISLTVTAQPRKDGRFSPEEFRARAERFIGQKAGFTAEEAQQFFPLYHELKGKQWELNKEVWKLKNQKPEASATDKEYTNILQKIKSLNVEIARLEETYYKRMCKAVPAKKVFKAMNAEDEFHRQTLSKFNHEKKGGPRPQEHK